VCNSPKRRIVAAVFSSNAILMLLKYTGSLVAGAYGVYATRQLQYELEQSLPTEIHLRIFPNMISSEYVTTWSLGEREIVRSKAGPFVVVGFKRKKSQGGQMIP
jgi:hypothetical protein